MRFIPAHAGNTRAPFMILRRMSVHPRACGEHPRSKILSQITSGSSPRMRGTRIVLFYRGRDSRFIPAHAGNTSAHCSNRSQYSVHPRACGEHMIFFLSLRVKRGSSPRMRGTLRIKQIRKEQKRFIPAHAGNTEFALGHPGDHAVHPRACGEHFRRRSSLA